MLKIAITGGLASGKSTVSAFFKEKGAYVIDADLVAHELLLPDTSLGKHVIQLLGEEVVRGGKIDREGVAKIVFNDPERLKELEALIHPIVKQEIEKAYQTVKQSPAHSFFVAEVPLLYEAQMENFFDLVVCVTRDPLLPPLKFDKPYREERVKRQLPSSHKTQRASVTLTNNGTVDELKKACLDLILSLERTHGTNPTRRK